MRARLLVLACSALLAGCTGEPAPPSPPPAGPACDAVDDACGVVEPSGPDGNVTASPAVVAPFDLVLHLTAERTLVAEPPAAGVHRETTNFLDPRFQTGQASFPVWLGAALPLTLHVTAARLDLWFSSDTPKASTSSALGFEPLVVWLGHDETFGATQQVDAPETLAPGAVTALSAPLALPEAGIVLEAGAAPAVLMGFGYNQHEQDPVLVHVGGERASRVTLTVRPHPLPPSVALPEQAFQGEFLANSAFVPAGQTGGAQRFPLSLNGSEVKVAARLAARDAAGPVDLDLVLLDPQGNAVAGATTPRGSETLEAFDVHLAGRGGEYALEVRNFQAVRVGYDLAVAVHARAG